MISFATGKRPGEIVAIEEGGLQIAARGGMIKVGKLRVDRREKAGATEFARSLDAKIGERFGE
jgi:methionyl-tRNA formyltransferase